MRNHYESEVGHFDGAVAPDVDTFASSLDVIDKMMEEPQGQKHHDVLYWWYSLRKSQRLVQTQRL